MASSWILVPCLAQLRAELNLIAPGRDRTTDGTIGDANHSSFSDHTPDEISDALRSKDADSKNEVHAYDADADLRTYDLTMEKVVQHILARCRSGAERRLRYIIFNRRIWEASNNWRQRKYTGASPHTEHAHFSASYETAREASTASWKLEDIPVALTDADWKRLEKLIDDSATKAADRVWAKKKNVNVGYKAKNPDGSNRAPSDQRMDDILTHCSPEHHELQDTVDALREDVQRLVEASGPQPS